MDDTNINVNELSLKEKAALAERLTKEVLTEMKSSEFANKSDNNKRLSGLVKVFGEQFEDTAEIVNEYAQDSD